MRRSLPNPNLYQALAQDQLRSLRMNFAATGLEMPCSVLDGDTPPAQRAALVAGSRVLLATPDIVHAALLPHHARYAVWWARLAVIVVDEAHVYGGLFGAHVANVLRRAARVAVHYSAAATAPRCIACTATCACVGVSG